MVHTFCSFEFHFNVHKKKLKLLNCTENSIKNFPIEVERLKHFCLKLPLIHVLVNFFFISLNFGTQNASAFEVSIHTFKFKLFVNR